MRAKSRQEDQESLKIRLINEAIVRKDVEKLRALACGRRGFINDGLRRRAWMILLQVDVEQLGRSSGTGLLPSPTAFVRRHSETRQIEVDVERSFIGFPSENLRMSFKNQKQKELSNIVNAVLCRNDLLFYYQGFHDICSILLLVLGERAAFIAAERLSLFFLRDAMSPNLSLIMKQLSLLYVILKQEDLELHDYLKEMNMLPYFCISWILTWFSHNLKTVELICRLFDFFISSNPLMPLYFAVSILKYRRDSIFGKEVDDPAELQPFIQKLPTSFEVHPDDDPLDVLDILVKNSQELYMKYPPWKLQQMPGSTYLGPYSCVNRFQEDYETFPFDDAVTLAKESNDATTLRNRSKNDSKNHNERYFYLDEPLRHIRRVMVEQEEHRVKNEAPLTEKSKLLADRIRMTLLTVAAASLTSAIMYFTYSNGNFPWFN